MVKPKVWILFVLSFLVVFLIPVRDVYAISDPDSISIESVRVFQNIAEADDQLYIIEYKVTYTVEPTEDSRDAFFAGITDGTSMLSTIPLRNYGHSFISIYLDSASALTWEGAGYFVRLSGNPTVFTSLTLGVNVASVAVVSTDWIDGTLSGTTPTLLKDWIIVVVENIERSTGVDYVTSGKKLNVTGSSYVEDLIPGIRSHVTGLFGQSAAFPTVPTPTFLYSYQSTLEANRGERLDNALDTLGSLVTGKGGMGSIVGVVLFLLLGITIVGVVYGSTRDITGALVVTLPLLFVGAKVGLIPLALLFIVFFLIVILFSITFILGRFS